MIKIVALTDSSKDEEHQEDETITQVSKEAQVNQKFGNCEKVLLPTSENLVFLGNDCRKATHYINK